jgi:hypothetical protein
MDRFWDAHLPLLIANCYLLIGSRPLLASEFGPSVFFFMKTLCLFSEKAFSCSLATMGRVRNGGAPVGTRALHPSPAPDKRQSSSIHCLPLTGLAGIFARLGRNGAGRFGNGINRFSIGINRFRVGINRFRNGINRFSIGVGRVSIGIGRFRNGINRLRNGINRFSDGINRFRNGINRFRIENDRLSGTQNSGRGVRTSAQTRRNRGRMGQTPTFRYSLNKPVSSGKIISYGGLDVI